MEKYTKPEVREALEVLRQISSENLCVYDPRYELHDEIAHAYEDDMPKPRINCACDNCFYGRDELANIILILCDGVDPEIMVPKLHAKFEAEQAEIAEQVREIHLQQMKYRGER